MFNFFKKEDKNLEAMQAKVGDIVDGEEVIATRPCIDEAGAWRKLTTKTSTEEIKVYEVFSSGDKIVKRLHKEE